MAAVAFYDANVRHPNTLRDVTDDIATTWHDPADAVLTSLGASAPRPAATLASRWS